MKKQRHHLAEKDLYWQSCGFSSSHVWIWELDLKEGWKQTNKQKWCFRIAMLKTLESPLDSEEIKPVNPKRKPWTVIGRTDSEAEGPILWPPDAKSWLTAKGQDVREDYKAKEERVTEDEMVGWRHCLHGHAFEQTLGDSEGQERLECCSSLRYRVRHDLATEEQGRSCLNKAGRRKEIIAISYSSMAQW